MESGLDWTGLNCNGLDTSRMSSSVAKAELMALANDRVCIWSQTYHRIKIAFDCVVAAGRRPGKEND